MKNKECKNCNQVFFPKRKKIIFCSVSCSNKFHRIGKVPWCKGKKLHYGVWNKGKKGVQISWIKGKHHSKETCEKISRLKMGQSSWNKGLTKNTDERIRRYAQKKIGFKRPPFSEKWLENISKSHKGLLVGEKNPAWKGGKTPLREAIRMSHEYKEWRLKIFERDNFTCQICKIRGGRLQIDHFPKTFSEILHENEINSMDEALSCEEFWEISNGRTLCLECHKQTLTYLKGAYQFSMKI